MPFYEYQCQACEYRLEVLQKISDLPLVMCPACQKPSLKKLISAAGFRLKGTGWYETDFKNSDRKSSDDHKGKGSDHSESPPSGDSATTKESGKADKTKPTKSGKSKAA